MPIRSAGCSFSGLEKSIKTLTITASVLFAVPVMLSLMNYYGAPKEALQETFAFWTPTQAEYTEALETYRGGYLQSIPLRIREALMLQTLVFLFEMMWRVCALMLLGMILFRTGFLSGERSDSLLSQGGFHRNSCRPSGIGRWLVLGVST